jgi:hypothetical protein
MYTNDADFMSMQGISAILAKTCCKNGCLHRRRSVGTSADAAFLADVEVIRTLRSPLLGKSKRELHEAVQGEIKGKPSIFLSS